MEDLEAATNRFDKCEIDEKANESVESIDASDIDLKNVHIDDVEDAPSKSENSKAVLNAIFYISVLFSSFQLYTAGFGVLTAFLQRSIHLAFVIVLVFLIYRAKSKIGRLFDYLYAALGLTCCVYIMIINKQLAHRQGNLTTIDLVLGVTLIVLLFIATKRCTGWALVVVEALFVLYLVLGQHIPGAFGHRAYALPRIISHLYLSTEGIWGTALGTAATFLTLFILFGAFLSRCGGADVFFELASSLTGSSTGGPAKVAVFSSAMMGMISGSAIANVATTGVFTIPLMKKLGYKKDTAGAIEAAASSGGAIMPPIMGSGAFIMSEFTGIAYSIIIIAAIVPALLYYLGLFLSVHFTAKKYGLRGVSRDQLPKLRDSLKKSLVLFIPLGLLVYLLIGPHLSAIRCAFWSILVLIAFNLLFGGEHRLTVNSFLQALADGARSTLVVSTACASIGIVVGVITLTGVGLAFTNLLMTIAGSSIAMALLLTMVATIIMGMAMPPSAAYVVTAAIAAAALVKMGLPLLTAHLFIFYYTCFAPITPPVAMASYVAAGISGGSAFKTGFIGFRFSLAGFICPFMFVYSPMLLLQGGGNVFEMVIGIVSAILGAASISFFSVGYAHGSITWVARILALAAGVLLIDQGLITNVIGLVLGVLIYIAPIGIPLIKPTSLQQVLNEETDDIIRTRVE